MPLIGSIQIAIRFAQDLVATLKSLSLASPVFVNYGVRQSMATADSNHRSCDERASSYGFWSGVNLLLFQSPWPLDLASLRSVELSERTCCHASSNHGHHTTSVIRRRALFAWLPSPEGAPSTRGSTAFSRASFTAFVVVALQRVVCNSFY